MQYCNAWLEYDDGRMEHYEVEFGTDSARYEYEIGLYDGAVLKSEQKTLAAPSVPSAPPASSGTAISEARAKEIAFAHAGVQAADTVVEKIKLDWEDGVQVYELEFRTGSGEYEYELNALDGTVLKSEQKTRAGQSHSSQQTSYIGDAAAKAAALSHAGVSAGDAWDMKCELDCDDGRYLYEVEFDAGGLEYEYEIDAETGTVLKAERDS